MVWVTYESNGAESGVAPPKQFTYSGNEIKLSENTGHLEKDYYNFIGWNTASDGEGTGYNSGEDISIDNNIILYAQWEPERYTISYNMFDGTNHIDNPDSYTIEDETITLMVPTHDVYSFSGWYTNASFTASISEIPQGSTGDVPVYAKWIDNIGDPGEGGGYIFYDKGEYKDGWRYMEAAPYGWYYGWAWAADPYLRWANAMTECSNASIGGYEDWYLPSDVELQKMYQNLHSRGLGSFENDWYWCSTDLDPDYAKKTDFSNDAYTYWNGKMTQSYVRPIRKY